jgi:V8-like Glu-specific endopeptidase
VDSVCSIGTGFFVDSNYILTCHHVVTDAISGNQAINYKFENAETIFEATTVIISKKYDLALLFTNQSAPLTYNLSSEITCGMKSNTAGFPSGSKTLSPAHPIIESLIDSNEKIKLNNANDVVGGFSGAPILDVSSKAIGIIVSTPESLRSAGAMLNIAHAIPTTIILQEFNEYLNSSDFSTNISTEDRRNQIEQYLKTLISGCNDKFKEIKSTIYPLEGVVYTTEYHDDHYGAEDIDLRISYQSYDESGEQKECAEDICKCINGTANKVVLLGEPGYGKSVSLLKLTIEFAQRALNDDEELIPILIPLGSYKDDITVVEYVKKRMGKDTAMVEQIFDPAHCLFIFDALNEVPAKKRDIVVSYITGLKRYIVSCRLLDYRKEFARQSDIAHIEILDLDLLKIKIAIEHRIIGSELDSLWKAIGGSEALITFWNNLKKEGRDDLFWKAPSTIQSNELAAIKDDSNTHEFEAWQKMHETGLLPLCRNPMLLRMVYDLYLQQNANLPQNRGQLFALFTTNCLESEISKIRGKGEKTEAQLRTLMENSLSMLTILAESIIINEQGTGLPLEVGKKILERLFDVQAIAEIEKFTRDANILRTDETEYRFIHQLHQEYFASRSLGDAFKADVPAKKYFNSHEWWEINGWEECAVILAGILNSTDVKKFLIWLSDVQPKLVIRCIENAGVKGLSTKTLDGETKNKLLHNWISRLETPEEGIKSRIFLGQAIEKLGDPRKGVGIVNIDCAEQPDIQWISVSQNTLISKYPITVKQFATFVDACDGYTDERNWSVSHESKAWHNARRGKPTLPALTNSPIVGISWYDAAAFCTWLSRKKQESIRLPYASEWETFDTSYETATSIVREKDLFEMDESEKLVSVGLATGTLSCISNIVDVHLVWEWCNDIFGDKPPELGEANPKSLPTRVLKGGSWRYDEPCFKERDYLFRTYATHLGLDIGFRVIKEVGL